MEAAGEAMELHSYGIHVHGLHPTMPMELEAAGEALAPVGGGSHNAISTPGHNQHIVEPAVAAAPPRTGPAPELERCALANSSRSRRTLPLPRCRFLPRFRPPVDAASSS